MGIIGRRLVSVLSLVVTIVAFCAAYAANVGEQLQLTTEKQAASKTIAGT
jgi:type II secretory pathway component PulK